MTVVPPPQTITIGAGIGSGESFGAAQVTGGYQAPGSGLMLAATLYTLSLKAYLVQPLAAVVWDMGVTTGSGTGTDSDGDPDGNGPPADVPSPTIGAETLQTAAATQTQGVDG